MYIFLLRMVHDIMHIALARPLAAGRVRQCAPGYPGIFPLRDLLAACRTAQPFDVLVLPWLRPMGDVACAEPLHRGPVDLGMKIGVYLSCAGVVCIIESSCGQAWTERYRFDARVSVLLFSRTTHASKGGIICHVRHEAMTMQCRHSYSREVTRLHQALGSIPGRHEIPLHHSRRSFR